MTKHTIETLGAQMEQHMLQTAHLSEKVDGIRREIFGNGGVGIAERVRALEKIALAWKRMLWAVAIGVAGLIGSLTWEMTLWFVQQGGNTK